MTDRLVNPTAEAALGDALHGRIYSAMLRFANKGMRADALTLRPVFASDGDAQYGDYLEQLIESPAVVEAAVGIAEQVADLAARRKARLAMHDAMEALHNDYDRPVDEICGQVEAAGWAAANNTRIDVAHDLGEYAGMVEERDDRIAADPGAVGMVNGLVGDIDRGLGALETGTYNIVAGRPGMGKSVYAGSLALGWAMNGHAGTYLQCEMKADQMALRTTSDLAHAMGYSLPHAKLRKGGMTREDRADLRAVRERAGLLPMRLITPGPCDIRRIWSLAAQQKAMFKARGRKMEWLIVDYLGLIQALDSEGRPIDDDRKRVNVVSKTIKQLADKLDLCVIALAQLSRGVEARTSKRPMLADLKESGNLEQDADTVTLLYREEYYLKQTEPKRGEKDPKGRDLHEDWENEMNIVRGQIEGFAWPYDDARL